MPITAIEDNTLHLACALFGAEHSTGLDALHPSQHARDELPDDFPGADETDILKLPPCPACDATEALIRSPKGEPEHPTPGSYGHLHRLLVDHVHDRVHAKPTMSGKGASQATRASQAALSAWFPDGLRLDSSLRESTDGGDGMDVDGDA